MDEEEKVVVIGHKRRLIDNQLGKFKKVRKVIKLDPHEPIITLKRRLKDSGFDSFEIVPEEDFDD